MDKYVSFMQMYISCNCNVRYDKYYQDYFTETFISLKCSAFSDKFVRKTLMHTQENCNLSIKGTDLAGIKAKKQIKCTE